MQEKVEKLISTKEKDFLHHHKRFSQEKKVIKQKEKKCFSTHRNMYTVASIQAVQQKQPLPLLVIIPGFKAL